MSVALTRSALTVALLVAGNLVTSNFAFGATPPNVRLYYTSTSAEVNSAVLDTLVGLEKEGRFSTMLEARARVALLTSQWAGSDAVSQASLMANLSYYVATRPNLPREREAYAQYLARQGLALSDNIPTRLEAMLLDIADKEIAPVASEFEKRTPEQRRSETAESWLHAWNRALVEASASAPALNHTVYINLSVPGVMMSGMAPQNIRDPNTRASYEKVLAENARLGRELNSAHDDRRMAEILEGKGSKFVSEAYANQPGSIMEVIPMLDKLGVKDKERDHILDVLEGKVDAISKSRLQEARKLPRSLPVAPTPQATVESSAPTSEPKTVAKRSVPYADKFKAAMAKAGASKEVGTAGPMTRADGSHTSGAQAAAVPPSPMPMVVLISTVCAAGLLWLLLRRRGKGSGSARTPVR